MRVDKIVRGVLDRCSTQIHTVRFAALLAVVSAIVAARRLCLTAVGRAIEGRAYAKHSIKRVDRLLGNPHLWSERWLIFAEKARRVIGTWKHPIILVDWTKVTEGFHALAAAVPIGGRALCIYEEVHPERLLGNRRVQAAFLRALRDVLPADCRPIIVSDAGFGGWFFREVRRLGWDFVGRIRGDVTMRPEGKKWTSVPALYALAKASPRDIGPCRLYKEGGKVDCRLVLAPAHRRRTKHPWTKLRHGRDRSTVTGGSEPWLLATSLQDLAVAAVIAIYAKRMQIEETFRDAKNHRFGFSLRHVRGYSARRLTILLLLALLAMMAATLVGLVAAARNLRRRYQANTVKKCVISNFVLGVEVLRGGKPLRGDLVEAGFRQLRVALQQLRLSVVP